MAQFATALELSQYLSGEPATLAELDDAFVRQANLILELIASDIETAAGVKIESGTTTVIVPGTWSRDLTLPTGPIRDVTAVTVDGVALAVDGGFLWNDRNLIRRGVTIFDEFGGDYVDDWSTYRQQGASFRGGLHWGGPFSTVRVTLDYGFEATPDFLRSLSLRIAARTLNNVDDVTQESLAIYSVTYRNTSFDGSHVREAERRRLRHLLNRTGGTLAATGR